MARAGAAVLALFIASAPAHASQVFGVLQHSGSGSVAGSSSDSFVRAFNFQHRLRVCNAFPYAGALEVNRGAKEKLTGETPLQYKECRDFPADLKAGDELECKIGDASAGTFSVTDLPTSDAVLMLVVHRHDTLSTSVAFESHVFANTKHAQVAVIDAYSGAARSTPRIEDESAPAKGNATRSEELRYNSVVAVSPGIYEISLAGSGDKTEAKNRFVALDHESYTILRTGAESAQGHSFPQELVVFPRSDEALLRSGAAASATRGLALLAALTAAWR